MLIAALRDQQQFQPFRPGESHVDLGQRLLSQKPRLLKDYRYHL